MTTRDYIETHLGEKVYLPNCEAASINIEDIAHALSLQPRFAGHIREHYSVAEHSLNVAELVKEWGGTNAECLQALLHDGTEAYLCDIPTPFKRQMPEYKAHEDDIWRAIAEAYNLPVELSSDVKLADRVMLMTERDYLKDNYGMWNEEYESTFRVQGWKPKHKWFGLVRCSMRDIEDQFILKFHEYSV